MEIKLAACGWGAFQGCASPPFFTQVRVLSASFCLLRIGVKSVWLVCELFLEGNNSLELEKVFTQVGSVSISFSLWGEDGVTRAVSLPGCLTCGNDPVDSRNLSELSTAVWREV